CSADLRLEYNRDGGHIRHTCINRYFIVISCGLLELHGSFNERKQKTVGFQLTVCKTRLSYHFRSADFKPCQIVCMIDNPHLIRFLIPDTDGMNVPSIHWTTSCRNCNAQAGLYAAYDSRFES